MLFAMLAAKAQCCLRDAKRYFQEHLCVGDYYTEGQQVLGQWYGQGAKTLVCRASRAAMNSCVCARIYIRKRANV